jgi:hypothetical protein
MKTFYSTEAQLVILFARNQRNLALGDLKVIPCGHNSGYQLVSDAGCRMAIISGADIALRIKAWCVQNGYRCSGVKQFETLNTPL